MVSASSMFNKQVLAPYPFCTMAKFHNCHTPALEINLIQNTSYSLKTLNFTIHIRTYDVQFCNIYDFVYFSMTRLFAQVLCKILWFIT